MFDIEATLEEFDRRDLVRARTRGGIVSTLELASAACLPRR